MTRREFLNAVVEANINEEMTNFAVASIEKLDAQNKHRQSKPSKTAVANEPIKKAILEVLTNEPMTASEIAEKCEISTQKASALLRQLEVNVVELKVPKKGKVKGYYI